MSDPRTLILAQTEDSGLVPLQGYDGAFIRKVSIGDADAIAASENSGLELIVRAVCDKDGKPLFTSVDVVALKELKVAAFRDISAQIGTVNRIASAAAEVLEKN